MQGRLARVLRDAGFHADPGGPPGGPRDVTFLGPAKFPKTDAMREYELKRGAAKALEGDGLRVIAAEIFAGAGTEGNRIIVTFGAIERMVAWTDGKKLFVDTTMKSGAPDHVATDTIKAFNTFLEKAAAFTPAAVRTFFRLSSLTGLPAACRTNAP